MFFEKSYYANVIYLSLLQGLMDTFDTVYPGVEHRFCVRHLHANCKQKRWKGRAFKDELFGAARAKNESDFKWHLNVIKGMSQEAFDYLEKN